MSTTTATKRKAKTPAQREAAKVARQAKIDQINAYMADADSQGLAESDEFADFSRSFARYSVRNQMLVMMQRPNATQVMGYRAWQAEGRQVRKGEKGIMIFGPAKKRTITEEKGGEEVERSVSMPPPVVTVFDISQTDPIEA